jgi:hypothetical protein
MKLNTQIPTKFWNDLHANLMSFMHLNCPLFLHLTLSRLFLTSVASVNLAEYQLELADKCNLTSYVTMDSDKGSLKNR